MQRMLPGILLGWQNTNLYGLVKEPEPINHRGHGGAEKARQRSKKDVATVLGLQYEDLGCRSLTSTHSARNMNRHRHYFRRLLAILLIVTGVQGCISPRQECEEAEILRDRKGTCLLFLSLDREACVQREAAGELSAGTCEATERAGLLYCIDYLDRADRCSKDLSMPVIPKIVFSLRHMEMKADRSNHCSVGPTTQTQEVHETLM